jgi:hypothetical protein
MPLTREDLCPGYVEGRRGDLGRCSCGLEWWAEMPPHLASGEPITVEIYQRICRRERLAAEAERRRAETLAADRTEREGQALLAADALRRLRWERRRT